MVSMARGGRARGGGGGGEMEESMTNEPAEARPIPTYFRCPISLELMSDPVTLSTGHTYDRSSIERWFRMGRNTCPQTRQQVSTKHLFPNLTLKNCITSWQMNQKNCGDMFSKSSRDPNSSTTRPLTAEDVRLLLESPTEANLRTLRIMAKSSHKNRKLICDSGALITLGSILSRGSTSTSSGSGSSSSSDCRCPISSSHAFPYCESCVRIREGALGAIVDLFLAVGDSRCQLLAEAGLQNLPALSWFLRKGSAEAKIHAVRIIECLIEDDDCLLQLGAAEGLIPGLVGLIRDHQALPKAAVRPSLRSLYAICLPKTNRSMAAEAGAVAGVIEILPGSTTEVAEGALALLNLMSRCSEGRCALQRHALCVPIMVKSLTIYSNSATENAVKILHSVLINNVVDPIVYDEAIKHGLIAKLLITKQMLDITNSDLHHKIRELLKELLLHCNGSDPCIRTITYSS